MIKNREDLVMKYIKDEMAVFTHIDIGVINKLIAALEKARKREATVYVCENGGSALTASHIACDFNKCLNEVYEKKFHIVCLNDNIGTMTAIANDIGYEDVYYRQLSNKIKNTDILLAISGSGNSANILKAAGYAKRAGTCIITFTGYDGGELKKLADLDINIPVFNMQIVEDFHLILNHLIVRVLLEEQKLGNAQ